MNFTYKTFLKTSFCLFVLALLSVTTYAATSATPVLIKPSLSVIWNSDTTNYAKVVIIDSSVNQSGYRIYRADGLSSSYNLITQIVSAGSSKIDTVTWIDSTIPLNSWANYKVAVFAGTDSLFSAPCSTYSFHSEPDQQVVTFTKLSDFPISINLGRLYGDSISPNIYKYGLSALAGDSLIIKDSLAPARKYSAINVKDPAHPKFDGYVDSSALLSYPIKTLLPVFLKYGVANSFANRQVCSYNNKMLVLRDSVLKRYQIQNNNLVMIDSLKGYKGNSIFLLDTTLLAVQYFEGVPLTIAQIEGYFYPIKISPTGFSVLPAYDLGYRIDTEIGNRVLEPNIQGIINNRIFVSTNIFSYTIPIPKITNEIIYDLSLNRIIGLSNVSSYVNSSNTGYCISTTEYLSTTINDLFIINGTYQNATDLYFSDIRNLHSYEYALSHKAVYQDMVHTKDQLQNILLDSSGKKIYLVFSNNLTILSYQYEIVGVTNPSKRISSSQGLAIRSGISGTTIVLPDNCRNADLCIFDVAGHVVEIMRNITSNAVLFRPKTKSANSYVAVVRNEGREYSARFMTR